MKIDELMVKMVREMLQSDRERVLEIYRMGLETRNATFETKVPSWNEWDSKYLPHSRYVSVENGFVNWLGSFDTLFQLEKSIGAWQN